MIRSRAAGVNVDTPGQSWILWLVVAAIGVHVIEEYALGFPRWALGALGAPVTWPDFHVVNAGVALYAIACAAVGWRLPAFSLSAASLVVVNALGFHAAFSLVSGTYSPGTATAVLLFVPAGLMAYRAASRDGVLTHGALVWSVAIGLLWHVFLGVTFALRYFWPA